MEGGGDAVMVKARRYFTVIAAAALLAVLLAAGLTHAADKPTITETYKVTIDAVGDGRVTDTIKYSKTDYQAVKKVQSKKRGFLTRRFTDEDTTGELVDFKTDMMDTSHSVVITYNKPGMAYATKGDFVLYGYSSKPKQSSGGNFTFEETSTVNSEFTLFTDQTFKTTTVITLPVAASNAHYDSTEKALAYTMPAATAAYGFWSDQKVLFSIIFGILLLSFAGLLVLVYTRKPVEAFALPAPGPEPQQAGHKFCEQCGAKLQSGERFCTNCGSRV